MPLITPPTTKIYFTPMLSSVADEQKDAMVTFYKKTGASNQSASLLSGEHFMHAGKHKEFSPFLGVTVLPRSNVHCFLRLRLPDDLHASRPVEIFINLHIVQKTKEVGFSAKRGEHHLANAIRLLRDLKPQYNVRQR